MSELLSKTESPSKHSSSEGGLLARLDEARIQKLVISRKQLLETIKSEISRKLYFAIEDKIASEQASLLEILDWQQGRASRLAQYSLILDPHYFEQEFM